MPNPKDQETLTDGEVADLIPALRRIKERLHLYDGDFGVTIIDNAIRYIAALTAERDALLAALERAEGERDEAREENAAYAELADTLTAYAAQCEQEASFASAVNGVDRMRERIKALSQEIASARASAFAEAREAIQKVQEGERALANRARGTVDGIIHGFADGVLTDALAAIRKLEDHGEKA